MNKTTLFKKMIMAIKDFDKYIDFAASSFLDTIKYTLKLVALFTVILAAISVYNVSKDVNNMYNYIKNDITEVGYIEGKLEVVNKNNEPIIVQNSVLDRIIIDTTNEKQKQDEYISEIQKVSSGIVFLEDKIVIKPINSNSMVINYSYKEIFDKYNISRVNKDIILEQISGINILKIYAIIFGITYIYQYIICLINILIYVVLIGSLGYFTSILLRLRIRYVALCKMVVYSLTLPIVLNIIYAIINIFTGFEIEYFDIIYIAISYIYIVAAILLIKADVIKRGQELQEIIKEQERIKEELERKKEEERRQKEEEERKKEEEKNKEKKKKDNEGGQVDNEPQGDNA